MSISPPRWRASPDACLKHQFRFIQIFTFLLTTSVCLFFRAIQARVRRRALFRGVARSRYFRRKSIGKSRAQLREVGCEIIRFT